jgi:UDP-N-acetylmuramyl tripeptide synthase
MTMIIEAVVQDLVNDSPSMEHRGSFGLCENSAMVLTDDIFIASAADPSQREKHIEQALAAGAAAVIYDRDGTPPIERGVPMLGVADLAIRKSACR